MSELEKKYERALNIICRQFYVIAIVFLAIEKVENGIFSIREKYEKGLPDHMNSSTVYYLSLEDIELIYEAMCNKSTFSSIHSRDQWGIILEEARAMEKEREIK